VKYGKCISVNSRRVVTSVDTPPSNRSAVARVITASGAHEMSDTIPALCRWCNEPITSPRRGQKFCCDRHRYLFHQNQRISPAKLDERIRAIVKEEIPVLRSYAEGLQESGDVFARIGE
jgi:hypothetical protein